MKDKRKFFAVLEMRVFVVLVFLVDRDKDELLRCPGLIEQYLFFCIV